MGDVSRHRDIFLASRDAVADARLGPAGLTRSDLTYVELGNYLTDVSQFRDPVSFIFTKQRIWRDKVIPRVNKGLPRAALVAAGATVASATEAADRFIGLPDLLEKVGYGLGGLIALPGLLPADTIADLLGTDSWIDAVLGTPIDRSPAAQTAAGMPARDLKHYGLLGAFFTAMIEGVTHHLFAAEVRERNTGPWGRVEPIPQDRVRTAYGEFFTQYWPHEHTDQPPYVWDAGKRPQAPSLYGVSRRGRTLTDVVQDQQRGVMNVVDAAYVPYLAEGLREVEDAWRELRRGDSVGRQRLLVRVGKLLHGVEDWYFHSNVVELLALTAHRPRPEAGEDEDRYLKRFVEHVTRARPEFRAVTGPKLVRLQRKLYRRLRFPAYAKASTPEESGGVASKEKSDPCLRHAYPAFPSQQDTANTLLPALEHLGEKVGNLHFSGSGGIPDWAGAVLLKVLTEPDAADRQLVEDKCRARGVRRSDLVLAVGRALAGQGRLTAQQRAVIVDVLREWVPLILTFLDVSERKRLVANVAPESWPLSAGASPPSRDEDSDTETELQQKRHETALRPRPRPGGAVEDNYARMARHLLDAGFLNEPGRAALAAAFAVDRQAEEINGLTPGCGNLLLEFAVEQQEKLDEGEEESAKLDAVTESVFGPATDNGAFQEIVGSHSLMSKDTKASTPFFDDARVVATVASNSVLTMLLEQVGAPRVDRRLDWAAVLRRLIRFPPENGGWERQALALFAQRQQAERQRAAAGGAQAGQPTPAAAEPVLPTIADIPELAGLAAASMHPIPTTPPTPSRPSVRERLEEAYRRLEVELREFRHP